ncbi:14446_t:CDS:2, partial [Gigaspora rosea]
KNITSNQNLLDSENQYDQVMAQKIVCMFRKAIQSGREETLHWCCYIERYDKRVSKVTSNDKVKIKTARRIEKIEQVTYTISNLTNTQIQNIINHILSKTMNKIHDQNNSEVSESTTFSISSSYNSNSVDKISKEAKSSPDNIFIELLEFSETVNILPNSNSESTG